MKDNYCLFLLPGIGTTPVDSEMRRHADLVPAVYYDTRSPTHTHTSHDGPYMMKYEVRFLLLFLVLSPVGNGDHRALLFIYF